MRRKEIRTAKDEAHIPEEPEQTTLYTVTCSKNCGFTYTTPVKVAADEAAKRSVLFGAKLLHEQQFPECRNSHLVISNSE